MEIDPRHYCVDELLRDGSPIQIRSIRVDDKNLLLEHFSRLSARSVYYRFLGLRRSLEPADLARLTELDFVNHVALAATSNRASGEEFIGVGRCIRTHAHRAEVAFAVLDEYQDRGIGTLLLEHLSIIARASGITEFEAEVLASNKKMIGVFVNSGFQVRESYDAGMVHVAFPIEESGRFLEAHRKRQQAAQDKSGKN
ncbi:MAG TPA: GNAT family N-acetyltransferase [Candidatus Binataceae bacterium]